MSISRASGLSEQVLLGEGHPGHRVDLVEAAVEVADRGRPRAQVEVAADDERARPSPDHRVDVVDVHLPVVALVVDVGRAQARRAVGEDRVHAEQGAGFVAAGVRRAPRRRGRRPGPSRRRRCRSGGRPSSACRTCCPGP